jgi:hypothetical protein
VQVSLTSILSQRERRDTFRAIRFLLECFRPAVFMVNRKIAEIT